MTRGRAPLALVTLLAALVADARRSGAQGVRVTGTTTAQLLAVRRMVDDSVAAGLVTLIPGTSLAATEDGRVVRCTPGLPWCRFRRPDDVASTVPVLQDLQVAAWGLGTGISAHAHVRARQAFGPVRDAPNPISRR